MKKSVISVILIIVTSISCFAFSGVAVSADVSDEGVLPFEDVSASHWFADAARFCYVNGVINGMNSYTFAPNGQLTRAQFVTMLANLEGIDLTAYATDRFTDVKPSHWYYNAVSWAYEKGIVSGTSETVFSPNLQINRETLSRIMMLYMTGKSYSVTVEPSSLNKFTDKGLISSWATEGMKYMVSSGLISGMTENTVAPKGVVTRAQAARILMVFMQNYFYSGHAHSFSPATCTEVAVCVVCGMADGLPKGHSLPDTYSCKMGASCLDCGVYVLPSAIQHDFAPATCGKPRTCKVCGITRGEPQGNHNWWAATCTNPKMCKVCYKTEGSALGHTTNNGKCSRCGNISFINGFDKAAYYLRTNGNYDSSDGTYYITVKHTFSDGDYSYGIVFYSPSKDAIYIVNDYYFSDGDSNDVTIEVKRNAALYGFEFCYYFGNDLGHYGTGTLNPATYNADVTEDFDYFTVYEGSANYAIENLNVGLVDGLSDADDILYNLYGGSVADLGFTAY